jgi:hypothetical protein
MKNRMAVNYNKSSGLTVKDLLAENITRVSITICTIALGYDKAFPVQPFDPPPLQLMTILRKSRQKLNAEH